MMKKQIDKQQLLGECPFCKSGKATVQENIFGEVFYVKCLRCGACGPHCRGKESAILSWNNSTSNDERLRKALKILAAMEEYDHEEERQ